MFGDNITLVKALEITIVSMFIVFFILSILSYVLSLFKFIPKEKKEISKNTRNIKKIENESKKEKFDPSKINDEKMLIAMMVATIEASGEDKNSTVRVIGIKEIN